MGAICCGEEPIDYDNVEVELGHFYLLRVIGKGAFGKVRIVQHKRDKRNYALKYINKQKCVRMRAVENIVQERKLLEDINHPFVVNLRFAFQDDENLFMVLDLMLGGDLRFHLDRRQGGMEEEVVRFYCAEMASAINYLHSKRIVHRDLKPDNVLLDEAGHAHLTDFNIAVRYSESRPLTAVAGSMAYMAPEVLKKRGYFATVDWWSLGIVCYELVFGRRPFRGKTNEQLRSSILNDELRFPSDSDVRVSAECVDALRGFIERDHEKRLGCTGFDKVKRHPWFRGFDWDKMERKALTPPFVPDTRHANFDATHELEELLLEDNPLKVKKRHKPKPGEKGPELSKEYQAMEDRFTVYDWYKVHEKPPTRQRKNSLTRLGKRNSYGSQASSQAVGVQGGAAEMRINEAKPDEDASAEGYVDLGGIDRDAVLEDDESSGDDVAPLGGAPIAADREKARKRRTLLNKDGLDIDDDDVAASSVPQRTSSKSDTLRRSTTTPAQDDAAANLKVSTSAAFRKSQTIKSDRRSNSSGGDRSVETSPVSASPTRQSFTSPDEAVVRSTSSRKGHASTGSGRVRKSSRKSDQPIEVRPSDDASSPTSGNGMSQRSARHSEDVRRPSAGSISSRPNRYSANPGMTLDEQT